MFIRASVTVSSIFAQVQINGIKTILGSALDTGEKTKVRDLKAIPAHKN
jgi:hypothetical protein